MAEVILHLVRDEIIESEPDIEDIDSTLEQIDEHAISFSETGIEEPGAEVVVNEAIEDEAAADPAEAAGSDTAALSTRANKPHKRHWRRRNLALEFAPGEAVSVSRRLYRSGESEYLLNDKLCRLRDIQDLFSGTGLSGGHYAIIEQGRIGQILSAKPMDRRTIIEEAAGITKFRVRQRAVEGRLESARGNLARLSDIISEIDRQVNSLRRQAAKARRYHVQRDELRELLRSVYVAEDRKLVQLLDETQAQLERVSEEERNLAAELAQQEEGARAATQEARRVEDALAQARASAADAALQRDREARERVYQQEQVTALNKRHADVRLEIEALTSRLDLVRRETERLSEQDGKLRSESEESALFAANS